MEQIDTNLDIRFAKSSQILSHARKSVAGGASSTMRVLDYHLPLVVEKAKQALIWDVDGNEIIDMNMGYGPLIFGHRSPIINEAIIKGLESYGTILGFPHELSHQTAELVKKSFPSIEKLRFASTGSEVMQTAVRLARAFTGRQNIVLFEGHYHGSTDAVFHRYHASLEELDSNPLWKASSGTAGMREAPLGVYLLPWNDKEALEDLFVKEGEAIAAVIMEPVMGNASVIAPNEGFLDLARSLTTNYGSLLIFDEVITGFRVSRGGAQEYYGVTSDLTTMSKAINGGVPLSAVGGRDDIMELLVNGTVFHGGVYSGNPLSLVATLAVQQEYEKQGEKIYQHLTEVTSLLAQGLETIFSKAGIPVQVQHLCGMLSLLFVEENQVGRLKNYREVLKYANPARYIQFQHKMQAAGVYMHPNHFEPWFLSTAHSIDLINKVLERVESVVKK